MNNEYGSVHGRSGIRFGSSRYDVHFDRELSSN